MREGAGREAPDGVSCCETDEIGEYTAVVAYGEDMPQV
jgi:hypothetical protein